MKLNPITNGLPPIHPGEFLRETLSDLDMTQLAFAQAIDVSPMRISHVVNGSRPITAEMALRLGCAFGQTPQYWLNLQNTYDLKIAETELKTSLRNIQELAVA
jgi:addiction module HigA family antidote